MATDKPEKLNIVWASGASTGFVNDPGDTKVQQGWIKEIPFVDHANYILNKLSAAVQYANENGIWDYDSNVDYPANALVRASNGVVYKGQQLSRFGDPDDINQNWARFRQIGLMGEAEKFICEKGVVGYPENTLPAFEAAGNAGYWGAKADIRVSADGDWFLMRRADVDTTTDGAGNIASLSTAIIESLDAGSSEDPYFAGTKVPTLEEFIDVCLKYNMVPIVDVQLATYTDQQLQDMLDQLFLKVPNYSYIVQSASETSLTRLREMDNEVLLSLASGIFSQSAITNCIELGNCCFTFFSHSH